MLIDSGISYKYCIAFRGDAFDFYFTIDLNAKTNAVGNGKLCPGAATWRTRRNNVVIYFGPLAPLLENMTSFTKPEVHNIVSYRKRTTEPRPQVTGTVNW